MSRIKLNNDISIDLPKLIESRLLVQANSGGGKSWAIRRIIEQSFGKVQIIVIDPEGEFGNLHSRYDFVYVGKDGDVETSVRSAALLASRLLELKASAIIDLYELAPQDRKKFVRLFCEAMVNAPKELWHDTLVIIDEAHVFAPEKGESEAMGSVIDLATRGRKRGYCLVLATQRISKLNKDAAAECNNKLLGRATQDIDRKRAAEELGFTSREQVISLRDLEAGEFYVFGPAISRDVVKTRIGDVEVKPEKRGVSHSSPPPPTENVKKILSKLSDLPQEAKKEADTIASLSASNKMLHAQIAAHKCPVGPDPEKIRIEAERLLVKAKGDIEKAFDDELRRFKKKVAGIRPVLLKLSNTTNELLKFMEEIDGEHASIVIPMPTISLPKSMTTPSSKVMPPTPSQTTPIQHRTNESITGPEQRVLDAIAWCESIGNMTPPNELVAFLSGYSHSRSTGYTNPRGYLKSKGLVQYASGSVSLTQEGRDFANVPQTALTQEALQQAVLDRLDGPERKLLIPLLREYPNAMTNANLCAESGYAHERSTGYTNPRGRLKSFGLVEYGSGSVKAASLLFI